MVKYMELKGQESKSHKKNKKSCSENNDQCVLLSLVNPKCKLPRIF